MRLVLLGLLLLAGPSPAPAQEPAPDDAGPLSLEQVLRSVEEQFPLLDAARAERGLAAGSLQAAQGGFDTTLTALGNLNPTGFYENYSGDGQIEQRTRLWGARLFGGYRMGRGEFPSYEGDRMTDRGGEFRGGVELPLLRGGRIDEPRARLRRAELGLRQVEPDIALQRIDFVRDATVAYWRWVATGLEVEVARRLLRVAEQRQDQLEGRVARGVVPRIDLVDNERLIVARRIRLRGAERDAEQSAIALSLYLRDAGGLPVIPPPERLPADFPAETPPDRIELQQDLERARTGHPLLRSLALQRESLEVELALARNERLPAMDLLVEGSRDTGGSVKGISSEGSISRDPKSQTEVKALIRLELPIQRREARGRVAMARSKLARLGGREQFARDRIEAEIRRAMAGLEAAFVQTGQARDNLRLALELQRAEERKLGLGTSNLIDVNIREIQAADAAVAQVETQAAYFEALARYRAAVATER